MAVGGFQRGIAWNKRHHAQRNAQWAYFEVQSPNERTSPNRSVRMPPLLEEVATSSPPQSGKRRRSEEEHGPGRGRKSSGNSSSAQSLARNYKPTPKDATQIFVPKYDPGNDWNPPTPARAHLKNMGGPYRPSKAVKPRNTLDQPSVQSGNKGQLSAAQQRLTKPSFKPFTNGRTSQPQQLQISTSKGSNVTTPLDVEDDLESERPPTKKSRLDSSLVDLTENDDFTQAEAIPARPGNRRSASHGSATGVSEGSKKRRKGGGDAFGNNELYDADREASNWAPKQKYSYPSVKGGIAAPPRQAQHSSPRAEQHNTSNGTAQSPFDVDANTIQSAAETSSTTAPKGRRSDSSDMPDIQLMNGVDEAGEAQKRKRRTIEQRSGYNPDAVNNVFDRYPKPSSAKSRPPGTTGLRRSIPQPQVYDPKQHYAQATSGSRSAQHRQQGNVRGNFVRDVVPIDDDDDRPVETVRMHSQVRPQQPLPASQSLPRDHSPDVLDGATTVGSQKSRSASPQKLPRSIGPRHTESVLDSVEARSSGSSLKPTNFTRTSNQRATALKNPSDNIWDLSEDDDGDGRARIASIFCKGYVCSKPGQTLVWDPNNECFVLADATGSYVYSPFRRTLVQISGSAVNQGLYSNRKSLKVVLKGSSDDLSNGTIILQFFTPAGKAFFYAKCCDSFGMKVNEVDIAKIDATFTNLANVEAERFLKAQERARQHAQHTQQTQRAPAHPQLQADDEVIRYEEESPPREKLVSKMKEGTLSEVLQEQAQAQRQNRLGRSRQHHSEVVSHHFANEPTRRSTRQSKPPAQYREPSPELVRWTEQHELPKWAKSVVYPQVGTRRVTVDVDDLRHLDAGEFLNDNIVNYALRHIEESMSPAHKERVHFFNTFFFSSLTTKNGKKDFNYDAVKKWTKNADLLSKPYIVVPINLDLHWFVAIIYNLPALRRKMIDTDEELSTEDAVDLCSEGEATPAGAEEPHSELQQMSLSDNAEAKAGDRHAQEGEALDGNAPIAEETARSQPTMKGKKGRKKRIAPVRKFSPEQSMIISLDSFGLARTNELRIIKRYVIEEAREKRQMAVAMDDLQGVNAKGIPQQDNFYDCGVYLIGYMKEFARDPDHFVKKILGRQIDENDFKEFNTTALRDEIRDTLIKYGDEQDAQYKKDKSARASARKNGQTPQVVKTPSGVPTSAQATATRADASAPPTSSQPARGSPSAEKLVRQGVPVQQQSLSAPRGVTPSSGKVAPSPQKSPRKGTPDEGDADENDDELEVDAPQPLTKSYKRLNEQAQSSPFAEPNELKDQENEHEMLDTADPNAGDFHGPRSATPPKRAAPMHNAHLSPLSSLEQDNRNSRTRSSGLASATSAGISNDMSSRAQIAAHDKISEEVQVGQDGVEDDETDDESVTDDSEHVPQQTVVIDIGDEGEPDPLGESVPDEVAFEGFLDDTGNNGLEIPDSQPDARQSQAGQ
ncbi:hypothetical protein CBER1_04536 [Cercospora berteroae]|uniref:Ubiquitin-like protease family profile domain-containing protein n=1 Tax=Cercospora berteroae TaxID=357750 RepID=A0A2S6C267_9PEZI|nr:hypothetical protein CBER1_04536 [Cercospora berteroae]